MTRIDVCVRCGRRLVITARGMCASCYAYPGGQVSPGLWVNRSIQVRTGAVTAAYNPTGRDRTRR